MKYKPVFIIGAGRSGTKYLRDVLSTSPEVVRIPYDVGYIWRVGNEWLPHDEINAETVPEKSIRWIRSTLPRLRDRTVEKPDARLLIEKSVPNSLRPLFLYKIFPNAIFIHLVRDGRAVTESALRMWQTPPEAGYLMKKLRYFPWSNVRYGLWYFMNRFSRIVRRTQPIWGPRYKGIENDIITEPLHVVCAKQWFHCVDIAYRQLLHIPREQVITVKYEEIMQGTHALAKLCKDLGIKSDDVLNYHCSNARREENAKWSKNLSPKIQKDISDIFENLPSEIKGFIFEGKAI